MADTSFRRPASAMPHKTVKTSDFKIPRSHPKEALVKARPSERAARGFLGRLWTGLKISRQCSHPRSQDLKPSRRRSHPSCVGSGQGKTVGAGGAWISWTTSDWPEDRKTRSHPSYVGSGQGKTIGAGGTWTSTALQDLNLKTTRSHPK
ncbi:hypothetical protein PLICRDRAFT_175692 [Plicaturopsis crispa FD-325 SS-3]|nr:hypothetical protein PLICRDRAFT_175692 [Plicaturopsis crispa FD-325 SS-3]